MLFAFINDVYICESAMKRELLNKFANYIGGGEGHLILSGLIPSPVKQNKTGGSTGETPLMNRRQVAKERP